MVHQKANKRLDVLLQYPVSDRGLLQPHCSWHRCSRNELDLHSSIYLSYRSSWTSQTPALDNVGNACLPSHRSHRFPLDSPGPQHFGAQDPGSRQASHPGLGLNDHVRGVLLRWLGLCSLAGQRVPPHGGPSEWHNDDQVSLLRRTCIKTHADGYAAFSTGDQILSFLLHFCL